jgi:hypothetical protein
LLLCGLLGAGCGGGTAAASGGGGGGGGSSAATKKEVDAFEPSGLKTSPVTLEFFLKGPPGGQAKATVYYQPDSSEEGPSGPGLPALTENEAGETAETWSLETNSSHVLLWRFESAPGLDGGISQSVRLWVQIGNKPLTEDEVSQLIPWEIGNTPPSIEDGIEVPSEEATGFVNVSFELSDDSSDESFVRVEFREGADPWQLARPAGATSTPTYAMANLPTSPDPAEQIFVWDSGHDFSGKEAEVSLRFTPVDIHDGQASEGTSRETPPFAVDNNAPPAIQLLADSFFLDEDERHGIRIPFRVTDAEGDPVRILLQWRRPGSADAYDDLEQDLDLLLDVLADPDARRARRIGTELPPRHTGHLARTPQIQDPLLELALPELPTTASTLLASDLGGRAIEILRPWTEPRSGLASWSTPADLDAPVGAQLSEDGLQALILEGSSATWSLRYLELATGAETPGGGLASGAGEPSALALDPDGKAAVVASHDGAGWTLHRVDLSDGSITLMGSSADGDVPDSPVRGLLSLGREAALVTTGDSLVRVESSVPSLGLPSTARALRSGLFTPRGLARDPLVAGRVFLAESAWPNPSGGIGRVCALDMDRSELTTLLATADATGAPGLPRPTQLAIERPGRLLAVVDADPDDGTRELVGLDLGATLDSRTFLIRAGLAENLASLSSGRDGVRLLTQPSPGGGDLMVGGGILYRRALVPEPLSEDDPLPFDPQRLIARISEPLPEAPPAGAPWRMDRTALAPRIGVFGTEGTLVWNVNDVPGGGEVVIRLVPYDTDLGTSSDLLLSKSVAGDALTDGRRLQLGPEQMSVADLQAVDADADGLLDLAIAGSSPSGSRSLGVMFQTAPGMFEDDTASPIRGSPATLVAAADFDGNGLLDLAGALDTPALVVHHQVLPRVFSFGPAESMNHPDHVAMPVALSAADMDQDGLPDLVSADFATSRASVYLQGPSGEFPDEPTFVLGSDADTSRPASASVGDLNADGLLDVLVAATNSNAVAIFRQRPQGGFDSLPDELLIGSVAPSELTVGDLDSDGLVDVVATIDTFDSLGIWYQHPGGGFSLLDPDQVLAGTAFNAGRSSVKLADLDSNGRLDLLAGGVTGIEIRHQMTDGGFDTTPGLVLSQQLLNSTPLPTLAADLDGNGGHDLAWAGAWSSESDVGVLLDDAMIRPPESSDAELTVASAIRDLDAADVDADGLLDLIAAMRDADLVGIWIQSFLSGFTPTPSLVLGGPSLSGPAAVVAADLDGDGRCDLATANTGDHDLAVFLQEQSGSFPQDPGQRLGGGGATLLPQDLAAADVDADGDLDLVSANAGGDQALTIFHQISPGVFATTASVTLDDESLDTPQRLVAADVDLDGLVDLTCTNFNGSTVSVFLQDPSGGFGDGTADHVLGLPGQTSAAYGLAVADLNGDRRPDILVTAADNDDVAVFLGRVEGPLFGADTTMPDLRVGDAEHTSSPRDVAVVDLDHDGLPDLVTLFFRDSFGESGASVVLYRQLTPGVFGSEPVVSTGDQNFPLRLLAMDLDGDGDPDLAMGDALDPRISVFLGGR